MSGKVEVEKQLAYIGRWESTFSWFITNSVEMTTFLEIKSETDRYLALISKGIPPNATIQFSRVYEALPNQEPVEKYYAIWEVT